MNAPHRNEFTHLSASNVNAFISRRPLWFLERVKGYRFPMGPVVHRGSAVETGAVLLATTGDSTKSIETAMKEYADKCADLDVDETEEIAGLIPEMIACVHDFIRDMIKEHGPIVTTQGRIKTTLPDWPEMKWLGFTDLEFEDGHILDIKTSKQTPSKLKDDWRRQGAVYAYKREKPVTFCCAVPLKRGVKVTSFDLTTEDILRGLDELVRYGRTVEEVLLHPRPASLAPFFMPATDDWALNDPIVAAAAKEVWGIEVQPAGQ